jgi:hypothetical protein
MSELFNPPYPEALAADLQVLKKFEDEQRKSLSERARATRRWFDWSQWIGILGNVLLIGLGAMQAGLPQQSQLNPYLTVTASVLGLIVGGFVLAGRELGWQREWLGTRAASEALKHEFFHFLGRVGPYGEAQDPQLTLRKRLLLVEEELEDYLALAVVDPGEIGGNE